MSESWTRFSRELYLEVDVAAGRARGRRLALERALREAVRSGRLRAGTTLPSSRALASDLGLSRGTVVEVYAQLAAEGYLVTRPRSATAVAEVPPWAAAPAGPAARTGPPRHDLRPGRPDPSSFPRAAWLAALRQVLATAPAESVGYGDPRGHAELRTALAGYLGRVRGVRTTPDRLMVCSGFGHGLGLLCQVLRGLGDDVLAVEDPGLPALGQLAETAGLRAVPVSVDERGLRPDLPPDTRAVLVSPAHHYPLGSTLHPSRRAALVAWARRAGGLVVEDDYDAEFRYDRQPVGALQGLAPDHVAYGGTASKSLAPAVRLAWFALPTRIAGPVTDLRRVTDRHSPVLDQLALARLVSSGALDRHLRRMRMRYRRRRDHLVSLLGERVPRVRPVGTSAGLHVTLVLPEDGPTEAQVVAELVRRGVAVHGLAGHCRRPPPAQGIVVGYGAPAGHAYPHAVEALVSGLSELLHA
jgi:GntR family transcriptional regulator / MocR family aminotransferase